MATDEYQYYDKKFVAPPFGFNNTGAICWYNSLLQFMLGMPALNRTVLDCEESLRDNQFACQYIKLLKSTLPPAGSDTTTLPSNLPSNIAGASASILGAFISRLREVNPNFRIGTGQECAHEAFTLFISMFNCPRIERIFSNVYELTVKCDKCNDQVSSTRDKSFCIEMFTPVKLDTKERFCMYIRVHPSKCDRFLCTCGHVMVDFQRTEILKMLREIVVIVFNKFDEKEVRWFPDTLEFPRRAELGGGVLKYKLIGKIEHSGTRFGGHYWACSLRDTWTQLNDTSVSSGNGDPTAATFMIAYHLVRDDTA